MSAFIQRDPEEAESLVAWWDGALQEGDQASVEVKERLIVFGDDGLLGELGPGRHQLTAAANPALAGVLAGEVDAAAAFITTTRYRLEADGEIEDEDDELEASFSCVASLRVSDASKLVDLIRSTDEAEQTVEEWLAVEIAFDVAAAAGDAGVELEDVSQQLGSLRDGAVGAINAALEEFGVELLELESIAFGDPED